MAGFLVGSFALLAVFVGLLWVVGRLVAVEVKRMDR